MQIIWYNKRKVIVMREKVMECLGKFPNKVNLELDIIKTENFDTYKRIIIEYNVEKDERVRSYLLVPNSYSGKAMPAVLAIHQHHGNWEVGKSEVVGLTNDEMYSYGLDLVNRGYVVIAPDIICFEDRMDTDKYINNRDEHSLYERFVFCDYLVKGSTLQAKTLHDLSCAIDVLCSLDFVDNDRIGAIGHSLGGQEVIYLQWYDKRIKAGISSCGASEISDIINNKLLHSFYLYIPNMLNYCDIDYFVNDITLDRYLMIINGKKDGKHCPLHGIKKIEDVVKNENFQSILFDGGHEFNAKCKQIAYNFFDDNLKQ